jgi:DNA-binding NtrC family response regulator
MNDADTQPVKKANGPLLPGEVNLPHRILVADDDAYMRTLITGMLVDSGYHVDGVENGAVAWEMLQVNYYNLLITDNYMPKFTGVELLHKLHSTGISMPVILATGTVPQEEFARHPWLEPAATLLKPYTLAALLKTVKAVLHETCGRHEQIEVGQTGHQPMECSFNGHSRAGTPLPGPNLIYEAE